jgi:hypothetical protein
MPFSNTLAVSTNAAGVNRRSLWICGGRGGTADEGLPTGRRPQLSRLSNNNNLPTNELTHSNFET